MTGVHPLLVPTMTAAVPSQRMPVDFGRASSVSAAAKRSGLPLGDYLDRLAAGQRFCNGCKSWQGLGDFGSDTSRADGRATICKEFRAAQAQMWRQRRAERTGRGVARVGTRAPAWAARMSRRDFEALFPPETFLPVPDTTPTFARRVFSRVQVTSSCWLWTGTGDGHGYGVVGRGRRSAGIISAHRAVWELLVGPIPEGLCYDHLCRVPMCVNPEHGELVTVAVNVARGFGVSSLHRRRTVCPAGHPLDGMTGARGGPRYRYCKSCARTKANARYHGMKEGSAK